MTTISESMQKRIQKNISNVVFSDVEIDIEKWASMLFIFGDRYSGNFYQRNDGYWQWIDTPDLEVVTDKNPYQGDVINELIVYSHLHHEYFRDKIKLILNRQV